jgi:antitoxin (DNA-binding transcriptional repressor) of toxin-antitoxin stability system
VVERLEKDGEPLVITRHRKPIAILSGVSEEQAASLAFAVAPQLVADRERAAEEIEAGEGEPATDLLAELEAEKEEEEAKEPGTDEIEIPSSLVRQLTATIIESRPTSARERELLNQYIEVLAEGSIRSVRERVRNLNANLLAEVGDEPAEAQEQVYVSRFKELATAEQLASAPVEVEIK